MERQPVSPAVSHEQREMRLTELHALLQSRDLTIGEVRRHFGITEKCAQKYMRLLRECGVEMHVARYNSDRVKVWRLGQGIDAIPPKTIKEKRRAESPTDWMNAMVAFGK